MHGILLKGLKEFVVREYGRQTWSQIHEQASVDRTVYLAIETYDGDELRELLEAATTAVDEPSDELLRAYGRSVGVRLLRTYGSLIDADWTALDLIEVVEDDVQPALEAQNPELDLPTLECRRVSRNTVAVDYESPWDLCDVAHGILLAVGDHYDEALSVTESRCMREGALQCEFSVTRAGRST